MIDAKLPPIAYKMKELIDDIVAEAIAKEGLVKLSLADEFADLNDDPEIQKWLAECEKHLTEVLKKELLC